MWFLFYCVNAVIKNVIRDAKFVGMHNELVGRSEKCAERLYCKNIA